jgi:hypothetical protein
MASPRALAAAGVVLARVRVQRGRRVNFAAVTGASATISAARAGPRAVSGLATR